MRQAEAEGLRRDLVEAVLGRVGAPSLASLADQIPPLAIPVRFERALALDGMSAGSSEIAPGSLRLRVALAKVVALGGRLWVQLDVSAAAGPEPARRRAESGP